MSVIPIIAGDKLKDDYVIDHGLESDGYESTYSEISEKSVQISEESGELLSAVVPNIQKTSKFRDRIFVLRWILSNVGLDLIFLAGSELITRSVI